MILIQFLYVLEIMQRFYFLFHMEHNDNTSVQLSRELHNGLSNNCMVWRSGKYSRRDPKTAVSRLPVSVL